MGSNPKFIPISKAAKILGRSTRKVQDLLDQGLMKWRLEDVYAPWVEGKMYDDD